MRGWGGTVGPQHKSSWAKLPGRFSRYLSILKNAAKSWNLQISRFLQISRSSRKLQLAVTPPCRNVTRVSRPQFRVVPAPPGCIGPGSGLHFPSLSGFCRFQVWNLVSADFKLNFESEENSTRRDLETWCQSITETWRRVPGRSFSMRTLFWVKMAFSADFKFTKLEICRKPWNENRYGNVWCT